MFAVQISGMHNRALHLEILENLWDDVQDALGSPAVLNGLVVDNCLFGAAWHRPIRLGFNHAACPDPCEELGQPVALRLVEKLADSVDMSLEQILNLLSGRHIAWAIKNGMVLIL